MIASNSNHASPPHVETPPTETTQDSWRHHTATLLRWQRRFTALITIELVLVMFLAGLFSSGFNSDCFLGCAVGTRAEIELEQTKLLYYAGAALAYIWIAHYVIKWGCERRRRAPVIGPALSNGAVLVILPLVSLIHGHFWSWFVQLVGSAAPLLLAAVVAAKALKLPKGPGGSRG